MKSNLFIIFSIVLFSSCGEKTIQPDFTCVSVLLDVTDSLNAVQHLTGKEITTLLPINPLSGANVSLIPITNLHGNRTRAIVLEAADAYSSNELFRKEEVAKFKRKIDSAILDVKNAQIGRDGTLVFEAISNQLQKLYECKSCTERKLVIVSDLRENSRDLNLYDSIQFNAFTSKPKAFCIWMDKHCPVPNNISGITIYLIHEPDNVADDTAFAKLSELLKVYLISKGATVYIQTEIQ